jgi:hypothetical protein
MATIQDKMGHLESGTATPLQGVVATSKRKPPLRLWLEIPPV